MSNTQTINLNSFSDLSFNIGNFLIGFSMNEWKKEFRPTKSCIKIGWTIELIN